MKVKEIIKELLEPKKPSNVKSSVFNKSGVQGSETKVSQRKFVTKSGNDVKVHFKQTGNDSVDITFYVNDSTEDAAVKGGKDVEILPGVLHIVLQYLKKSKVNYCTFEAAGGSGDYKTKYNLPKDKIITSIKDHINQFKDKLSNTKITPEMEKNELDRINALRAKLNKPLETTAIVIYKDQLLHTLSELETNIETIEADQIRDLIRYMNEYSKNVLKWPEFEQLMKLLYEFQKVLSSYSEKGALIHRNRRQDLYSKLVDKYLSNDWDIETTGTMFYLTRK